MLSTNGFSPDPATQLPGRAHPFEGHETLTWTRPPPFFFRKELKTQVVNGLTQAHKHTSTHSARGSVPPFSQAWCNWTEWKDNSSHVLIFTRLQISGGISLFVARTLHLASLRLKRQLHHRRRSTSTSFPPFFILTWDRLLERNHGKQPVDQTCSCP